MATKTVHAIDFKYDIPKEVLTPVRVLIPVIKARVLMIEVAYGFLIAMGVLNSIKIVYRSLQLPYMIFVLALGVFWILPSPVTKGKRNIEQLIMVWFRTKETYHPVRFYREITIDRKQ